MLGILRDLLGGARRGAAIPPGVVCYAVGDIHGRLDLLDRLLLIIGEDAAKSPDLKHILVFLGDYVDRGPESRGVIQRVMALQKSGPFEVWALKGNHEEAFLTFLADPGFGASWAEHGGGPTLLSYGVEPPRLKTDEAGWREAHVAFVAAAPPAHIEFMKSLHTYRQLGDYAFVHAGVRPGRPMEHQVESDLLWIRGEFLAHPEPLSEIVVVHGHTPMQEPQFAKGRIGVDTGAYATGVLTALRLEADSREILQARAR